MSHGNASRRSCERPPNDPRARPPWHVSSSAASSFLRTTGGQRQTLLPGLSDRTRQASIDLILTQVPRLTDAVAGAEFEGEPRLPCQAAYSSAVGDASAKMRACPP